MNIINQNGMTIIQHKDHVIIDGQRIDFPDHVMNSNDNSISIDNGKIVINGHEFDPVSKTFAKPTNWWKIIKSYL